MPDLIHTLQGNDLGFLRMVAGAWGIELNAPDAYTARAALTNALHNHALVNEVVESLPVEARQALQFLLDNEGHAPWALFTRRFGEVRAMGAARRDRERPDLNPTSPVEVLWYRALLGRAFLNLTSEADEYAYIPDDLLEYLSPLGAHSPAPLGRPATPGECAHILPASDAILEHACTLLAALRLEMDTALLECQRWSIPCAVLKALLHAAGLLDERGLPKPQETRAFLEAQRAAALAMLGRAWMESQSFNDLRMLPGLIFEGEWQNPVLATRQVLLGMISNLPQDTWWNLNAFVAALHERNPDFQRSGGDYDSWFIRRAADGTYLRGFASWDEVDGALVRFITAGMLHWLGIFDLAAPAPDEPPAAFRPSAWAADLWHGRPPDGLPAETGKLTLSANGLLRLPPLTPRPVRYQIARFCAWENQQGNAYFYRLTPAALETAEKKGLRVAHLISLLRRYSSPPLPPGILKALEQWEKTGTQVQLQKTSLLRVTSSEILDALRRSPAARHLGETLNATTIIIKPGGEDKVRDALVEIGYLVNSFTEH